MAEAKTPSPRPPAAPPARSSSRRRSSWITIFAARPRLLGAALLGAVVGLGLSRFAPAMHTATDVVVGWDVVCAAFMLSVTAALVGHGPNDIRARAEREDEGRGLILALVLLAAAASVAAIAAELSLAKTAHGFAKMVHVALAFGTVAASWLMVQFVFALHYAHEYYDENPECDGHDMKGLKFPGEELPDYWAESHPR